MTGQQQDIVKYEPSRAAALMVPIHSIADLLHIGGILAASGFFANTRDEAQAVAKILAGMELGIAAVASLRSIYIVEGQITLAYPLIGALIKRSGKYNFKVKEKSAKACIIEFYEAGELMGTESLTWEQVEKRGLHLYKNGSVKEVWKKFPENMLFARCLSNGAKAYTSEVFSGPVYTPDELGADVDGTTGTVIEIEAVPGLEIPLCYECKNFITPYTSPKSGKTMSAEEIVQGTREKYGDALCWDCAQERKKELAEGAAARMAAKGEEIKEAVIEHTKGEGEKAPVAAPAPASAAKTSTKGSREAALAAARQRYQEVCNAAHTLGIRPRVPYSDTLRFADLTSLAQELRGTIQDAIWSVATDDPRIESTAFPAEDGTIADWMTFVAAWDLAEIIKAGVDESGYDGEGEEEFDMDAEELAAEIPN